MASTWMAEGGRLKLRRRLANAGERDQVHGTRRVWFALLSRLSVPPQSLSNQRFCVAEWVQDHSSRLSVDRAYHHLISSVDHLCSLIICVAYQPIISFSVLTIIECFLSLWNFLSHQPGEDHGAMLLSRSRRTVKPSSRWTLTPYVSIMADHL